MWLGLDIGGVYLKAADAESFAACRYFPIWQNPETLADALRELIDAAPTKQGIAVTMTAELADCFSTKAEGVRRILESVEAAAAGRPVRVYLCDGSFAEPAAVRQEPLLAAAANWHALARLAGRFASQGAALLIDVGSTTTDLIPLTDGMPVARGTTDPERLVEGELVYTGVERSPVCAVVQALPWRGHQCPTAHELFATTQDAYLILGDLPEDPDSTHTADGRPATKPAAVDRLARAICADRTMFDANDAHAAATAIARAQLAKIGVAAAGVIRRLPEPPNRVIVSGQGEFLARRVVERMRMDVSVISLSEELSESISRSATAHAVAVLARDALS
jgi:hypothetical protein